MLSARMCGKLVGEDGKIQIPGFYDDVVELTAIEKEQYAALPFSKSDFLKEVGSSLRLEKPAFDS